MMNPDGAFLGNYRGSLIGKVFSLVCIHGEERERRSDRKSKERDKGDKAR